MDPKPDAETRGKHWKASLVLKPLLGIAYFALLYHVVASDSVYIDSAPDLFFAIVLETLLTVAALVGLMAATASRAMMAMISKGLTGRASKLRFVGTVLASVGLIVSFVVLITRVDETSSSYYSFFYSFFISYTVGLAGLILSDVGELMAIPGTPEEQFVVPASVLDSFQRIGVDNQFSVEEFYVFVVRRVYILLEKKFLTAYFIRLFDFNDSPSKRIWLGGKRTHLRNPLAYKNKFNRLPVFRLKGVFSIPIGVAESRNGIKEDKYVKGSGVLYWVSMYPVGRRGIYAFAPPLTDRFNEQTIRKLIDDVAAEQP